jgi:hypothetical protein
MRLSRAASQGYTEADKMESVGCRGPSNVAFGSDDEHSSLLAPRIGFTMEPSTFCSHETFHQAFFVINA